MDAMTDDGGAALVAAPRRRPPPQFGRELFGQVFSRMRESLRGRGMPAYFDIDGPDSR